MEMSVGGERTVKNGERERREMRWYGEGQNCTKWEEGQKGIPFENPLLERKKTNSHPKHIAVLDTSRVAT